MGIKFGNLGNFFYKIKSRVTFVNLCKQFCKLKKSMKGNFGNLDFGRDFYEREKFCDI